MHSDIGAMERMEIIRDLRMAKFDVLVGINLLREGLDLPEVSLIAILDADKEGFLRSETSLIQTIGRAARNARGSGSALRRQDHACHARAQWTRPPAAARFRTHIIRNTALCRRQSSNPCATSLKSPPRRPPSAQGRSGVKMTKQELAAPDREAGKAACARPRTDDGIRVCRCAARRDYPPARGSKSGQVGFTAHRRRGTFCCRAWRQAPVWFWQRPASWFFSTPRFLAAQRSAVSSRREEIAILRWRVNTQGSADPFGIPWVLGMQCLTNEIIFCGFRKHSLSGLQLQSGMQYVQRSNCRAADLAVFAAARHFCSAKILAGGTAVGMGSPAQSGIAPPAQRNFQRKFALR